MRLGWIMLVFVGFATPAYADLDYKCLQTCVKAGTPSSQCLTQCTYQEQPPPNPATVGPNHSTNYQCLYQCTGTGYSYGYCQQGCTQ